MSIYLSTSLHLQHSQIHRTLSEKRAITFSGGIKNHISVDDASSLADTLSLKSLKSQAKSQAKSNLTIAAIGSTTMKLGNPNDNNNIKPPLKVLTNYSLRAAARAGTYNPHPTLAFSPLDNSNSNNNDNDDNSNNNNNNNQGSHTSRSNISQVTQNTLDLGILGQNQDHSNQIQIDPHVLEEISPAFTVAQVYLNKLQPLAQLEQDMSTVSFDNSRNANNAHNARATSDKAKHR